MCFFCPFGAFSDLSSLSGGVTSPTDSSPPPEISRIVDELGNGGFVLLLFEAPSGFAVFAFDGAQLFLPNAVEIIWLKEFKTFKNKSNVFNHTGVNKELAEMIRNWHVPGQLLAVGKPEYKTIIESKLKIPCLYTDAVLEAMWGIKNLMKSLVPREDCKLSKKGRLHMSYGMKTFLSRHGFDVTPEMVNEDIVEYACILYDCELCETKHSEFLTSWGECLKEISGIEFEGWSMMKLAAAFKILCIPDDDIAYDDPELDFSEDELFKLKNDGSEYDGILLKRTCVSVYRKMVRAHEVMARAEIELKSLIAKAEEANEVKPEGFEATLKQEMPESSEAAVKQAMPESSEAAVKQEMPESSEVP
ncbi:unnamed protein product [Urochloa humidicola]